MVLVVVLSLIVMLMMGIAFITCTSTNGGTHFENGTTANNNLHAFTDSVDSSGADSSMVIITICTCHGNAAHTKVADSCFHNALANRNVDICITPS